MKHENPYREGQYHEEFAFIMKKQYVTRKDVLDFTLQKFGKYKPADVTVLLSPRKSSTRGDCRGNISAQGGLYYMEKLPRQVKAGVKEPQKFRLRWREKVLEPRTRQEKVEIQSQKTQAPAKVVVPEKITEPVTKA